MARRERPFIDVGVETSAQRERLFALGCQLGQGYLFGKPLEPTAADTLLSIRLDRRTT